MAETDLTDQSRDVGSSGAKRTSQLSAPRSGIDPMFGPAASRKRDCAWKADVADVYPACLIGSRGVALMGRDFTLRGLVTELAERGLKVDYRAVWNFVLAERLSFKKNRGGQRT
jgi:hypothetical protein